MEIYFGPGVFRNRSFRCHFKNLVQETSPWWCSSVYIKAKKKTSNISVFYFATMHPEINFCNVENHNNEKSKFFDVLFSKIQGDQSELTRRPTDCLTATYWTILNLCFEMRAKKGHLKTPCFGLGAI